MIMNDDFKNDGLRDLIVERDGYLEQLEEAYKTINQLTNNWNELEEYVKFQRKVSLGLNNGYGVGLCDELLDRMNEIKNGGKNDIS